MEFSQIHLSDYWYNLPDEKIAKYPLAKRDQSRLLVYKGTTGEIEHKSFTNMVDHLPADASLFFNNTKVIPARLLFQKATGATIEIFLLEPKAPSTEIATTMLAQSKTTWHCMIKNMKKWKHGEVLMRSLTIEGKAIAVKARLIDPVAPIVTLTWGGAIPFAKLLEGFGEVPLPPYLKRKAEDADKQTYQTVYSEKDGAVAAPTAGLHFTQEVLHKIKDKGIKTHFLTLHVSAGTFQPIKEEMIANHPMHSEQMVVSRENVLAIYQSKRTFAVGTTSMRTLESLYWFGAKLILESDASFVIEKLMPYQYEQGNLPTKEESIKAILAYMDKQQVDVINGQTSIFIFPGYKFRICDGLITNFHQPGSTLILLVAAFIGKDWRKVYSEALSNDYRFLSYGDSSLLIPSG